MQKILKQSHIFGSHIASNIATSAAFAGVLAILFLFAGISVANADTTYVVDATNPNGTCGTVCQQLQAYLSGAGTNVSGYTGGNSNIGSNGYGSNYGTGNPYFSPVGNNGVVNGGANYGSGYNNGSAYNPSGTNNGSSGSNSSGYTPYPYMVYNYYNNPNLSGVPNTYGANVANQPYGTSGYGTSGYGTQNYGAQNYGTYSPYGTTPTSAYAPAYNSASYNPYSNRMYVQYPQSGSSTKSYSSGTSGAASNKGFTLTSGH